jgi:hypothetical protein
MAPVAPTSSHVGPLPPTSRPSPATVAVYTATIPLASTIHSSTPCEMPRNGDEVSRIASTTAPPTMRGTVASSRSALTTSLPASVQSPSSTIVGTIANQAATLPARIQAGSGSARSCRPRHHRWPSRATALVADAAMSHAAAVPSHDGADRTCGRTLATMATLVAMTTVSIPRRRGPVSSHGTTPTSTPAASGHDQSLASASQAHDASGCASRYPSYCTATPVTMAAKPHTRNAVPSARRPGRDTSAVPVTAYDSAITNHATSRQFWPSGSMPRLAMRSATTTPPAAATSTPVATHAERARTVHA